MGTPDVTTLLGAWSEGNVRARDQLMPVVYSRIAELRFFGGLSLEGTGHVLSLSIATVEREREWQAARAWLYAALKGTAPQ
jgi:hypothetical protein